MSGNFVLNSCLSLASVVQELGPPLQLSTIGLAKSLMSLSVHTLVAEVELVKKLLACSSRLDKENGQKLRRS
jgi:hypothetical protein